LNHDNSPRLGKVAAVQIITMLVAVVSMLIDGIITGLYLGEDSLAAYGLTNPVNMFLVALGGLLAAGAQVLGGRCAGRKDEAGLNCVLTTSVTFGFLSGLVLSILIALLVHPLTSLLGADPERLGPLTEQYLSGIVFCLPVLVIGQVIPGFLQIKSCRRQILIAALAQIASDVLLDYLNVTVFHDGLRGMALASVVSCCIYVALMLIPLYGKAGYRFSLRGFSLPVLKQICAYGLLYLVYKLSVALMGLYLNRTLAAHGGVAFLTANSIIFSIELIIGAIPSGFGSTVSILIGIEKEQAGEEAAARLLGRMIRLSLIVCLAAIVLVCLFAHPLVSLFSSGGGRASQLAVWGLRLYVLAVLPNTVNYIVRNYELNMDRPGQAYLICLMNHIVLPMAAGLLLTFTAPLQDIWLCFVIGHGLCLILSWRILRASAIRREKRP